ncbi:hypothetical protein SDC9_127945 [bioreactor metagenome]|uniref:Flagellar motor switch protein FliG N-terminal domain-containing protein n=1 Tax=bioreactor metagenome TaxID=1076179 RepID=A0A645CVG2_9ZZZZ
MAKDTQITPEQKAAAIIISLGVEKASQIYKYLTEEEIKSYWYYSFKTESSFA